MPPASPAIIVLYEGVSAYEAMGALAALRAAEWPVELAGAEALVASREGARLVPHRLGFDAVAGASVAIVPGGDVAKPLADAALVRALRARRGHFTLAGGAASRLLHAAGLLDERRVSVLPGDAAPTGAVAVHARLVADARLLTCFPGDALVDLVLHHVGHEDGVEAAKRAAARLGREHQAFAFGQTT